MCNRSWLKAWALGLGLAAAGLVHGAARATVLYDVPFGLPHQPGMPAVTGNDPIPRHVVSPSVEEQPLVVEGLGALTDHPLRLTAVEDQSSDPEESVTFRLDDIETAESYSIEVDVVVTEGEGDAMLSLLIDAPAVRRVDFNLDGSIGGWASGGNPFPLGTYTLGEVVHVRADVDLDADLWSIWIDGVLEHVGDFESASSISTVRVSTDVHETGPSITGAIDNVLITIPEEGPCSRVKFNDLTISDTWVEGESFFSDGVRVDVSEFFFDVGPCGGASASGQVKAVGTSNACAGGKELWLSNVTLDFDFYGPVTDVLIRYGEYGGTQSLSVNGVCEVVDQMNDLDGRVLGGVLVTVFDETPAAQGCGVIRLGGEVTQLSIGGQEFYVDQISYCPSCWDLERSAFEDQTLADEFSVGDSFLSGAATHTFRRFAEPGVDCTSLVSTGVAIIGNGLLSCQDGLELNLNNINDDIDFGRRVEWLALAYGEFGGNINLRINGDCRNTDNFADLNGELIGGVLVWAVDYATPGQSCGTLYAVGEIDEFGIGGQELWIDNIRTCPDATTGVEELGSDGPPASILLLAQNAPNPLRSGTEIRFDLAAASATSITIHDIGGRLIRNLAGGVFDAGTHRVWWDGRNERGERVPAGVYAYRVEAGQATAVKRMVLLK